MSVEPRQIRPATRMQTRVALKLDYRILARHVAISIPRDTKARIQIVGELRAQINSLPPLWEAEYLFITNVPLRVPLFSNSELRGSNRYSFSNFSDCLQAFTVFEVKVSLKISCIKFRQVSHRTCIKSTTNQRRSFLTRPRKDLFLEVRLASCFGGGVSEG